MPFFLARSPLAGALLAAAGTAGLAWFGTGLHPAWPLLWLAPLPVLLLAPRVSACAASAAALAAWFSGGLNLWAYYRAALRIPAPVVVGMLLAGALAFVLDVLLFRALLRRGAAWSALAAFPAAWVSCEYLLSLASPHGTAGNLAYTQLDFVLLLQVASLAGPWGMSFLVLLLPAALAVALRFRPAAPGKALRVLAAGVGAVALALAFGAVRLATAPAGPTVKVALLASDGPAGVAVAGEGGQTERLLREYADRAMALGRSGARVIVLPEKIGVVVDPATSQADAVLQQVADETGAELVVGLVHASPGAAHNEARIYAPGVAVRGYAKQHLLPPYESRFQPGAEPMLLGGLTGRRGVAVCKDMDFTSLGRSYGRVGAGLLLVPAWDFVSDRRSHGHMAVMRGVESGFSVARSARQGLLTVSDSRGRILAEVASDSAPFATLVAEVPAVHQPTLYLVLGDWFAWVSLAVLVQSLVRLRLLRVPSACGPAAAPDASG